MSTNTYFVVKFLEGAGNLEWEMYFLSNLNDIECSYGSINFKMKLKIPI